MAVFTYKGRNAQGRTVHGSLEAQSSVAMSIELAKIGIIPVDIAPAAPRTAARPRRQLFPRPIRDVDLMLFTRQMSALARAAVPLLRAIDALAGSCPSAALGKVLREVHETLDKGE